MTNELTMLALAIVLGLVHAVATGGVVTAQHGAEYGLSPRDAPKPVSTKAARLQRAFANYMETFPFFAAAVLIAQVAGRHSWLTILGADLYLLARVIYVPLYVLGIPVVRSVAWGVSVAGIVMILISLA